MKTAKSLCSILLIAVIFTSCKKDETLDPTNEAYENAIFSKGGIMYDRFWSTESGFNQNDVNLTIFNASSDFFRCKQCHGWDGLGSQGAYISRGPTATRPNISPIDLYQLAQTNTAQELFDGIKMTASRRDILFDLSTYNPTTNSTEGDKMPNYSQLLTDSQIWDIVKFMKEGMFNTSQFYDATYSGSYPTGTAVFSNVGKNGNATVGNNYYTANCTRCHGADGTALDLEGKTLGAFIRSKPNEAQHKIRYGQLGTSMVGKFDITLSQMKDLYKACSDVVAFP